MSKKKSGLSGLVYSTDPDLHLEEYQQGKMTIEPNAQLLKVALDTKNRAGKKVTVVYGFEGNTADLESLAKKLKSLCGSGGSVKDEEILIQGDHRDKVITWLRSYGYTKVKKS